MRLLPEQPAVLAEVGAAVVDVTAPLDSFDFSTAKRWNVLVLDGGEPVVRLDFPSPGPIDSADLARAIVWPHAEMRRSDPGLAERSHAGSRSRRAPAAPPSCSVILCTHGRPEHLAMALDALARLDPAPLEVIVVDNAPGERDCEREVAAKGFRYVREDRKGLDNARNAGVRAASGEVLAFTDDDCVHPAGWLRHLAEGFEDPMVGALTGPAFPYSLDRPARVRMERQASLTRGLRRRVLDWTLFSPVHAGQTGVGANVAIRASLLKAVRDPFPPELDAGTETMSGGDTYVLARLLAAGHRVVYDPRAFVFHQHRADWSALDKAIVGYGVGAGAAFAKLLVQDREWEAPRAAWWSLGQYLRTQRQRMRGHADAVETRIAWRYLRGALQGPLAWRRALRTQRAIDPALAPAPAFPPPTARPVVAPETAEHPAVALAAPAAAPPPEPAPRRANGRLCALVSGGSADAPAVSVVVPTVGRAGVLTRCLAALEAQTLPMSAFEVIVVDDSPDEAAAPVAVPSRDGRLALRVHRTGGRGAAVARNQGADLARGELLLFLDDDLIAAPDLLERHVASHAGREADAVVIGYSPPRPARLGLAALSAALWWEDHFRLLDEAPKLTFMEALSGNASIGRATFLDGRGFDPGYARLRREDWEWGARLLATGVELRYDGGAVAAHEFELTAARRIRACRLEAGGDVRIARRHPHAAALLPLGLRPAPTWRRPLARLANAAVGHPRADVVTVAILGALERANLRSAWSRTFNRVQRAAYVHGLCTAGWRPDELPAPRAAKPGDDLSAPAVAGRDSGPVGLAGGNGSPSPATPSPALGGDGSPSPPRLRTPVTVLLGPARLPGDDRHRRQLTDAGARVEILEGTPAAHWERILEAAAAADTETIAIPLPGWAPSPAWLAHVEPAFAAPRVELALGQSMDPSRPVEPLTLRELEPGRMPYAPLAGPSDYLVLRRRALPALRRAAAHAAYGPIAVALACADDVLVGGGLVAHRNAHGLDPTGRAWPTTAERERDKLRAWGALLAAHALDQPPLRGAAWAAGLGTDRLAASAWHTLRRDRVSPASRAEAGRSLLQGYAAAIRRREPTAVG